MLLDMWLFATVFSFFCTQTCSYNRLNQLCNRMNTIIPSIIETMSCILQATKSCSSGSISPTTHTHASILFSFSHMQKKTNNYDDEWSHFVYANVQNSKVFVGLTEGAELRTKSYTEQFEVCSNKRYPIKYVNIFFWNAMNKL